MSPQDTQAWIVAPDHEFAPEGVPLCPAHADRISVPFGWSLTDDRPAPKKKRRRKKAATQKADPVDIGAEAAAEPLPEPVIEPDPETPTKVEADPVDRDPLPEAPSEQASEDQNSEHGEIESAVAPVETADGAGGEDPGVEDGYVAPEYQFREDAGSDEPTIQMPAVNVSVPVSPAEVPLDAEKVAVAVDDDAPRLSVVPGDDDPNKTYDFSDEGQGAFWHEPESAEAEPDESTPLLQRAFRVVRDD